MPRRSPSPSLRVLQSGGSEQQDGGSQEACSASGTLAVERPASHGGGGPAPSCWREPPHASPQGRTAPCLGSAHAAGPDQALQTLATSLYFDEFASGVEGGKSQWTEQTAASASVQ